MHHLSNHIIYHVSKGKSFHISCATNQTISHIMSHLSYHSIGRYVMMCICLYIYVCMYVCVSTPYSNPSDYLQIHVGWICCLQVPCQVLCGSWDMYQDKHIYICTDVRTYITYITAHRIALHCTALPCRALQCIASQCATYIHTYIHIYCLDIKVGRG